MLRQRSPSVHRSFLPSLNTTPRFPPAQGRALWRSYCSHPEQIGPQQHFDSSRAMKAAIDEAIQAELRVEQRTSQMVAKINDQRFDTLQQTLTTGFQVHH
eukprot:TRINITY_DN7066_c0_g1_i3.p2 TRINITY_DN7066_c0_g1~~TRINITY_DN7066_c0_g1_i3.p2  ORF type:complete len:100 (+),score=7.06 TRINITY_DN7066_c0_g1_i3:555-854(+)